MLVSARLLAKWSTLNMWLAGHARNGEAVRLDDLQQRVEGVVGKRMQEPSC